MSTSFIHTHRGGSRDEGKLATHELHQSAFKTFITSTFSSVVKKITVKFGFVTKEPSKMSIKTSWRLLLIPHGIITKVENLIQGT